MIMGVFTSIKGLVQTESGKKNMIICSEWLDNEVKIIVFRDDIPVMGVVSDSDMERFAHDVSQTKEDYWHQLQCIFSGEDTDIEFELKNDIFEWSRPYWSLGQASVCSLLDVKTISKSFCNLAEHQMIITNSDKESKNSIKNIRKDYATALSKVEDLIRIKTDFERDMYKKFLPILNAKKKRISELMEQLRKTHLKNGNKFEVTTDESGESDDSAILKGNSKQTKRKRLKSFSTSPEEQLPKKQVVLKSHIKTTIESNSTVNQNKSKDLPITATERSVQNSQSEMDATPDMVFSSEESECEIQLKDEEEVSQCYKSESKLHFEEEASEDDLF